MNNTSLFQELPATSPLNGISVLGPGVGAIVVGTALADGGLDRLTGDVLEQRYWFTPEQRFSMRMILPAGRDASIR